MTCQCPLRPPSVSLSIGAGRPGSCLHNPRAKGPDDAHLRLSKGALSLASPQRARATFALAIMEAPVDLSAKEAEEMNAAFEAARCRNGSSGPRFLLVPREMVHGHPERVSMTPKIHYATGTGGYLGKYNQTPGVQGGARSRSGPSGPRAPRGPRGNVGAVAGAVSAITGGKRASGAVHGEGGAAGGGGRTKRPSIAPSRITAGGTDGDNVKAELREAKKVLKEVMSHRHAWPFSRPVDIIKYPMYLDVVKEPMDLGTCKTRLERGIYKTLAEFSSDLSLVWTNCFKFNEDPNSDVCVFARELQQLSEERLAQIPELLQAQQRETTKKATEQKSMSLEKQLKEQQKLNKQLVRTTPTTITTPATPVTAATHAATSLPHAAPRATATPTAAGTRLPMCLSPPHARALAACAVFLARI